MNKRCLYPECSEELIDVYTTRRYCDNNNRCKNAHYYQIKKKEKAELLTRKEVEKKKENCIHALHQILINKTEETLELETLKLTGVDLTESYIDFIKGDISTQCYRINEFELVYLVEQNLVNIKRIDF
jgi:hypothetical protein